MGIKKYINQWRSNLEEQSHEMRELFIDKDNIKRERRYPLPPIKSRKKLLEKILHQCLPDLDRMGWHYTFDDDQYMPMSSKKQSETKQSETIFSYKPANPWLSPSDVNKEKAKAKAKAKTEENRKQVRIGKSHRPTDDNPFILLTLQKYLTDIPGAFVQTIKPHLVVLNVEFTWDDDTLVINYHIFFKISALVEEAKRELYRVMDNINTTITPAIQGLKYPDFLISEQKGLKYFIAVYSVDQIIEFMVFDNLLETFNLLDEEAQWILDDSDDIAIQIGVIEKQKSKKFKSFHDIAESSDDIFLFDKNSKLWKYMTHANKSNYKDMRDLRRSTEIWQVVTKFGTIERLSDIEGQIKRIKMKMKRTSNHGFTYMTPLKIERIKQIGRAIDKIIEEIQ